MSTGSPIREELSPVEARTERLTADLRRAEAERDQLRLQWTDLQGAHDRRFAGVRSTTAVPSTQAMR